MAAWWIPALKAVLPHVGSIVSAAAPAFTKKRPDAAVDSTQLLQQQIGELQAAAGQNAAHIKALAAQLESTVAALEQAGLQAQAKLRRAVLLAAAAAALAAVSLCVTLLMWVAPF